MNRLNLVYPQTIIEYDGQYYHSRPEPLNEFSKFFDFHVFCKVDSRSEIDPSIHKKIDGTATIIDFFERIDPKHFLLNYATYRTRFEQRCDMSEDYFLVNYPFYKTTIFLAWMLRDTKLTVWVLSDYVALFDIPQGRLLKDKIKKALQPLVRFSFPKFTKRVLDNHLVLYTGEIIYNKDNRRRQHSVTEIMGLNQDESRIQRELTNDVVFVGPERRQKGLITALKAIQKTELDLDLHIIGVDELDKYAMYDDEHVHTHGRIYDDELFFDLLAQNDILLMPSIGEKQGKVQIEAMSAGVVPICSDTGGIPRTVENFYTGLLFEENAVSDLVDYIEYIYENPEIYRELQENGLEYTSQLDSEKMIQKVATLIQNHFQFVDSKGKDAI